MSNELIPMGDIEKMGKAIAESGLFGMKTPAQAIAMMLIAQAEGMHPAIAARDYHIIQNRPSLKADAMLARFQERGGSVEWHEYTDAKVSATFKHPQGGSVKIEWDMARAKQAELGVKDNWKKYPRQMLRARVISEGIRTIYPGISVGIYTPEEVQDFEEKPKLIETVAHVIRSEPAPQPEPQPAPITPTGSQPQHAAPQPNEPPQNGKEKNLKLAEIQQNIYAAIGADNWGACKALLAKKYAEYGTLSSILLAKGDEIITEIKTKGAKAYIEDLPF